MSLPGASTLLDNTCGCAHSACRDGSSLSGKCCCDKAVPYHSLLLNICSSTGSVLPSNPTILNLGLAIERKHRSSVCAQVQHLKIQSLVVLISRETLFISSVKLWGEEKNPELKTISFIFVWNCRADEFSRRNRRLPSILLLSQF